MFSGQLSEAALEMLEHLRAQQVKLFCWPPVVGNEHAGPSLQNIKPLVHFKQVFRAKCCACSHLQLNGIFWWNSGRNTMIAVLLAVTAMYSIQGCIYGLSDRTLPQLLNRKEGSLGTSEVLAIVHLPAALKSKGLLCPPRGLWCSKHPRWEPVSERARSAMLGSMSMCDVHAFGCAHFSIRSFRHDEQNTIMAHGHHPQLPGGYTNLMIALQGLLVAALLFLVPLLPEVVQLGGRPGAEQLRWPLFGVALLNAVGDLILDAFALRWATFLGDLFKLGEFTTIQFTTLIDLRSCKDLFLRTCDKISQTENDAAQYALADKNGAGFE